MTSYNDLSEKGTRRILLLTDHNSYMAAIQTLKAENYSVTQSHLSQFETGLLERLRPAAVLLDLDQPTIETISICQTLRPLFDGPILILAAKADELIQVLGMEMGADDFLFKPQSSNYLLVKLRSILRRFEQRQQPQKKTVQLGELVIDASRREVWCSGESVPLTAREFDLLWCLAENAKNIISRDEIHQTLYNSEYNGYDRAIDIYISRIRQKIGDDPLNPRYLKTVRGAGYLLVEGYPA